MTSKTTKFVARAFKRKSVFVGYRERDKEKRNETKSRIKFSHKLKFSQQLTAEEEKGNTKLHKKIKGTKTKKKKGKDYDVENFLVFGFLGANRLQFLKIFFLRLQLHHIMYT